MNRSEILAALSALGARLLARGVNADLYLVGGAAMALAYDDRRSTRDIDAVFVPKLVVYEAAAQVAEERGLPQAGSTTRSKASCWDPIAFRPRCSTCRVCGWRWPVRRRSW